MQRKNRKRGNLKRMKTKRKIVEKCSISETDSEEVKLMEQTNF